MADITKTIVVDRPVREVYNQWTQFEDFPRFMSGVKAVRQIDPTHVHWQAEIAGNAKEWDAEITEQEPDRRISWKSVSGAYSAGTVRFEPIDAERTVVHLTMAYDPQGPGENVADLLGLFGRQVEQTLFDFKRFIEQRDHETGGWRGEVHKGHVRDDAARKP